MSFVESRLKEAEKMGFKQAYLPSPNLPDSAQKKKIALLLSPVNRLNELLLPVDLRDMR